MPPVSFPGQPRVSIVSITATSISLSWNVPSNSVVTSYEVMWRALISSTDTAVTDSDKESGTSGSITDTSYTIEELESATIYNVTVTVINVAGSTDSHPIIISTGPGTRRVMQILATVIMSMILSHTVPVITASNTVTAAVSGGSAVAVVIIITIAVTIIVIVVLHHLRSRGSYSIETQKR